MTGNAIRALLTRHKRGPGTLLTPDDMRGTKRHALQAQIRSRCHNAYLGDGRAICRVLGRYKMVVDTNDLGLSGHLLLDGFWEMWLVEALLDLVEPGMTVLDAGANLGYFTLLMADLVGAHGHVHAVEPNPHVATRLRATIEMNGFFDRTTLHLLALSDRDGHAALAVPAGEPKNGHVIDDVQRPGAMPVALSRLDSIDALLDFDLMKIDVEGSEERLWAGMAGLLARRRPLTILLEFTAGRYADAGAFLQDMLRHGFMLHHLTLRDGIVPVEPAALLAYPPHQDQMIVLRR